MGLTHRRHTRKCWESLGPVKVNIILSTFNGEKYLSQQIDSILAQTYTDWSLLIRDDGSGDGTRAIIESYAAADPRIRFINPDDTTNVGVHRSFKELAAYEDADWYFLSDQDDVWLPEKIEAMLDAASGSDPSTPHLYYSDLTTVTEDLTVIKQRVKNRAGTYRAPDLKDYLTGPPVTGCAAMFNRALRGLWLRDPEIIAYHDSFLGILAVALGELTFIDESYVLYRQHDDNAVGVADKGSVSASLKLFWGYNQAMVERSRNVLETFPDKLSRKATHILSDFCSIAQEHWWKRLATLAKYRYRYTLGDWKYTVALNSLLLTQIGNT